jgi:hypothetical protein
MRIMGANTGAATLAPHHSTASILAVRDRPSFLASLAALTPSLRSFASDAEAAHIVEAILDVCHCWP